MAAVAKPEIGNGPKPEVYLYSGRCTGAGDVPDVLDGLLLPSDVEGRPAGVRGSARQHHRAASEHQDARRDLEAGHVLPQRAGILPAHNHLLQQTLPHQHHRKHSLLAAVSMRTAAATIFFSSNKFLSLFVRICRRGGGLRARRDRIPRGPIL